MKTPGTDSGGLPGVWPGYFFIAISGENQEIFSKFLYTYTENIEEVLTIWEAYTLEFLRRTIFFWSFKT